MDKVVLPVQRLVHVDRSLVFIAFHMLHFGFVFQLSIPEWIGSVLSSRYLVSVHVEPGLAHCSTHRLSQNGFVVLRSVILWVLGDRLLRQILVRGVRVEVMSLLGRGSQ